MKQILLLLALPSLVLAESKLPNILWVTSEDNGPHLGCYGDEFADTPNLDKLAEKSLIYRNAWSTAPVCAPARTTIISGMYPPSTGSQHMRSMVDLPEGFLMYPQYLREAGYYCINPGKEDYNVAKQGTVWDDTKDGDAKKKEKVTLATLADQYKNEGKPFMAVFNHTISHESKLRTRPHEQVLDPAGVRVPAYHPDTPEVRQDWAQYYDRLTEMDAQVGQKLEELEAAGLNDSTIIFYYGDHGSGMPRSKRWPYNSGLNVPLIVHIPEKFQHLAPKEYKAGGETDRLVGFIDLAPTLLSLAGIEPPEHYQGHAFLGEFDEGEQKYGFGFRGRMDERYDFIRTVRDKRYQYIRNYNPHELYGQHVAYMFVTPTTQVWKRMFDEGKLNEAQSAFWKTKPAEEFYDLEADPDQVNNLIGAPEHAEKIAEMREAQKAWALEIRDLGFLPEGEFHARADAAGITPYELGQDNSKYKIRRIMAIAETATMMNPKGTKKLISSLAEDKDSGVRYWAALGLMMRGEDGVKAGHSELKKALSDENAFVRVAAAEALARYGAADDLQPALDVLITDSNAQSAGNFEAMAALNSIDVLDEKAAPLAPQIAALPHKSDNAKKRTDGYVGNLLKQLAAEYGVARGQEKKRRK
ncbi:MAG: sulfatase-like hydrolase/transferase [Verrucomicrobiota bacterium]